ncbi:MAG TPA: hypothetical protein VM513_30585 [Kofleriaceae bacterium]|nr:hypothetical protein [Kofleriaceae bacterium]
MRTELLVVASLAALVPGSAEADSCVPGFDYAIFAKDALHIQGNATTDSWSSALGTYASTKTCGDADIGSNSASGGAVYIQGASSQVCGDAFSGAGSTPTSVITGNGTITGSKSSLANNLALPAVTLPSLANASPLERAFQNTNATLAPNLTYGAVSCKNGSLTLSAGKYLVTSMTLTANCELQVTSGPIEVYFTGTLDLSAGTVVNATQVPGNLVFYGSSSATTVRLQGGVDSNVAIYAPSATCELKGNADLYGAIVCDDVEVQGNAHVHYDTSLGNLAGGGFTCPVAETSRATPIVTTVDGGPAVVQGSFERPTGTPKTIASTADVATFAFPYIKGHMRARSTSQIATTASAFSAGTAIFDAGAAGKIPPVSNGGCTSFHGACRNVFTVTQTPDSDGVSFHPPRVQLDDTNASAIGALIAPANVVSGITATHWQTIVRTVLAGSLGGVDRSTVAVIGPSALASASTRPTVAYFGATDGMLHAVCASTGGSTPSDSSVCPSLGTELWAFLPRVQLPLVRRNTTRLDGSVRVVDAFGDFVNNPATGTKRFRTILTFQTGYEDRTLGAAAAVYALDVTDPANPAVLWEYTRPASPGTFELGVGLSLAAGPTLVDNRAVNLVVAQTNNGGTSGPGVVATALSLETGARVWQFGFAYPSPPRGDASALPLPTNGVPGGAVGVDLAKQGFTTDFVMGDLYGNLWRLTAATGASQTGTSTPLFSYTTNKHPIGMVPAIYSDGSNLYAAFASGGYTDPVAAGWASGTQSMIGVRIDAAGPYPLTEATTARLAFKRDLGTNEKAYAQLLVVGDQLFLTTDTSDVNASSFGASGNTGHVVAFDLRTAASTSVVVRGGASSLAQHGTQLFSSSSDRQQRLASDALSATGSTVDTQVVAKLVRMLWLRTQ